MIYKCISSQKRFKNRRTILLYFFAIIAILTSVIAIIFGGWKDTLYTPTQIVKVKDNYYISDCWNGRIIYSHYLGIHPKKMNVLSEDICGGHSIASDGEYIMIDDSDNHKLRLYYPSNDSEDIVLIDELDIEDRPHYIQYYKGCFFILGSYSGSIYEVRVFNGKMSLIDTHIIDRSISYARSFSIVDNIIFIPTADGRIYEIDLNSWRIKRVYYVPDDIGGMNFIDRIGDYFYLTVYSGKDFDMNCPSKILRGKKIEDFENNTYEDITNVLSISGTPYFITQFDGLYYLTEIDSNQGIIEFSIDNQGEIKDVKDIYEYRGERLSSKLRKNRVFK